MLFDTDIFIWVQKGNLKAARLLDETEQRFLSVYSYMELLQAAKNSQQHQYTADFLSTFGFVALPLTERIGHRALIYLEEYTLAHGLKAGDAIVAATAVENNLTLVSGNAKHFKAIQELKLKIFKP
jgi:predicted nucleic acid-binding protein